MKLLVRNLSRDTTKAALSALFSECGSVQSCNIVIDKASGLSKGFAFVEMPKVGEAKIAINKLNNASLDGAKLRVKKAEVKLAEPGNNDD
ncbi:RNA recognition motif domain-containing protein [Glaciecola sp. SC05]|uniref:RNA recognition motif domain-containing protein n=1 Tax=Glaciecola sp. SC05 TaxID=1987355 RepID=UPI00352758D2